MLFLAFEVFVQPLLKVLKSRTSVIHCTILPFLANYIGRYICAMQLQSSPKDIMRFRDNQMIPALPLHFKKKLDDYG